jgi:acetyltransferase-like isoleucine patch superfamily enzyme
MGCIVYYNAIITHDCYLGDFVQVAPGVSVLGGACVDSFALIGSNATILPRLTVGRHAVVAAGSVVSRPVPDHALVIGNPARRTGWVSEYGHKINFNDQGEATCPFSGEHYRLRNDQVMKVNQGE